MIKKGFSLVIAVVLVFGMASVAGAASGKITGVTGIPITDRDFSDMQVQPGATYEFPLTADMFSWSESDGASNEPVTKSQLDSARIGVKATYNSSISSKYIKEITIEREKAFGATGNQKTAYVRIKFVDSMTDTTAKKFDFTLYLTYNGGRQRDTEVRFTGEISREEIYVDADQDYVDISGGEVVKSDTYIREMDFDLGNGLILKHRMYEDTAYYGTCKVGATQADEKILDAYPEIDEIYRLTTNLTSAKVFFELGDIFHVYDEGGLYLGTTEDELKYSSIYYLATDKISLNGTSGSSSSSSASSSSSMGDDYSSSSSSEEELIQGSEYSGSENLPSSSSSSGEFVNNNPTTGSSHLAGMAVVLALASAAVIVATRIRKK